MAVLTCDSWTTRESTQINWIWYLVWYLGRSASALACGIYYRDTVTAHKGHLDIVKLKQQCHSIVWWPGINRKIETLVKDGTACLLSGKTRTPATAPPVQPLDWPPQPWEHQLIDICGELHGVLHHQQVPCCDLRPLLSVARGDTCVLHHSQCVDPHSRLPVCMLRSAQREVE